MSTNCVDDNFVCMKKSENKKTRNIFFCDKLFSDVILFRRLLVLFKKKKKKKKKRWLFLTVLQHIF